MLAERDAKAVEARVKILTRQESRLHARIDNLAKSEEKVQVAREMYNDKLTNQQWIEREKLEEIKAKKIEAYKSRQMRNYASELKAKELQDYYNSKANKVKLES